MQDKRFLRGIGTVCVLLLLCLLPSAASAQKATAQESFVFSFPSIPDSLTSVGSRASYLVSHYWDKASFPAALSSADNDSIEQAWVNYCDLFSLADSAVVERSLSGVLSEARFSASVRIFLMSLAEKYFFDSDSPYCNDAVYLCALKAFVSCRDVDCLYQMRYAAHLRMLEHCREGGRASDFGFVSGRGTTSTLYRLSASHVLLMIYDPECDHCKSVIGWLKTDERIASLRTSGKLAILSVNVGEADNAALKPDAGHNWIDTRETHPDMIAGNL
ncbi:DUF5106 domain-containing protein [Prevotella sp. HUN102]|uniref:DUF5106 domain-containing protein n=1 Tax=Prevotella sp. HUN102 TaxID=1392486 RepID=UPI000490891B|nr:DUF5106 domain-containing protein [Prevotella sp. HUN102]